MMRYIPSYAGTYHSYQQHKTNLTIGCMEDLTGAMPVRTGDLQCINFVQICIAAAKSDDIDYCQVKSFARTADHFAWQLRCCKAREAIRQCLIGLIHI